MFVNLSYSSFESTICNAEILPMRNSSFLVQKRLPIQWFLKRLLDFSFALFALISIFPVFLLIALAIRLESQAPIIFKQKRVGYLGKEFYIYKFRSMVHDAERLQLHLAHQNETNSGMFKMFNDPRVTRVGRYLRKHSLDELPQLINVIKGEMSLVGPRPPINNELLGYKDWHYNRFATLPGLTGIWQTHGRSRIKDFDRVVKMDLLYIKKWSIFLDLILLIKTIPVVLLGKDSA